MLRRVAILSAVLVLAALAPATADAAPRDIASTHAYLVASYKVLHGVVSTWPAVEGSIHRLDRRLHGECPDAGAGSPENAVEGRLSYEATGALWASGYHTDAALVHAYVHTLLAPYVQPADRALRARDEHLDTRFEELEFMRGQSDWIALLETVGLNE